MITFRQTNPPDRTNTHNVSQLVISPVKAGSRLQEILQSGSIREFLFEMIKDGHIYWVGVAVPAGTADFSKVQVFFHPTVRQKDIVHAKDSDYPTFTGGWSGSLQRYVEMQGGQLAGARQTALIVPFMTMASFSGKAPAYMFATRPVETLNAIVTAARDAVTPAGGSPIQVTRIGVSSFSSGIGAMRLFIGMLGGSGLIAETTDFDSPFITGSGQFVTRSPGAPGRVFSQISPPHPQAGWVTLPAPASFRDITKYREKGPHAQIGWMMFFTASLGSTIA